MNHLLLLLAAQSPPDDAQIVADTLQIILSVMTSGQAVGGLLIAGVVVTALVGLSKLTVLKRFLTSRGLVWVQPVLAAVLGGAGGALAAISQGKPLAEIAIAFVAGVAAGLVGIGAHELKNAFSATGRAKIRVPGDLVSTAADAMERQVLDTIPTATVPSVRSLDAAEKVRRATALPEAERLATLAELLKSRQQ